MVSASAVHRLVRALALAAGIVLLAVVCRAVGLEEFEAALAHASPLGIVAFLALGAGAFAVHALRWRSILSSIAPSAPLPSLGSLALLGTAGHAVSFLVPSAQLGGEPLRAFLLRRRGVDLRTAASSVALDRLADITASSIVGPAYVALFAAAFGGSGVVAPTLAAMGVGLAALALFYAHLLRGGLWLSRLVLRGPLAVWRTPVRALERRLAEFVRSPALPRAVLLSFVAEALVVCEFVALTRAFGIALPLPALVGVLVGLGMTQVAPIPAALGSLEAIQVGVSTLAGRPADLGLAVGLIVRVRETVWTAVGLGVLYGEGIRWRSIADPLREPRISRRPKSGAVPGAPP